MSYSSIVEMVQNGSLLGRITAAAAGEQIAQPDSWAASHMWALCSSPEWDVKWDYAKGTYQVNANPDFGARTDVISDGDILAAVQAANTEGA